MHSPGDRGKRISAARLNQKTPSSRKKTKKQKTPTNIFEPRGQHCPSFTCCRCGLKENLFGEETALYGEQQHALSVQTQWNRNFFLLLTCRPFYCPSFLLIVVLSIMNGGYEGGSQHISRHVCHWLALLRANQLIIFPRGCQQQLKRVHQQLYRLLVQDADISQSQQSAINMNDLLAVYHRCAAAGPPLISTRVTRRCFSNCAQLLQLY